MLKHFLVAIALTFTAVVFSGCFAVALRAKRGTEPTIVIVPPDSEAELPVAGIEIVQGDRKQTFWLYSESQARSRTVIECEDLKRRFVGS